MPTMLNNTFLTAITLSLSLTACAESPPNKSLHSTVDPATSYGWNGMTYSDWEKMLQISKKCTAKYDGNDKRFINIRKLNDSTSILAISCELGAYQDGNRLYLLKDDKALPLIPELPKSEESWHLEKQEIVWGNQYTEGNHLVLENWFAGSGECGYRAFYSIADVISQKSPKPEKVYGDANCQDGVFLDDWPLLEKLK